MTLRKLFRRTRRAQRGMTLLEIMVVITILGLIAGAITVAVIPQLAKAKRERASTDIKSIENALDLYKVQKGRYPGTDEGLGGLITEKMLKKQRSDATADCKLGVCDPWGRDYVYLYPGAKNADGYDIISYGGDGRSGGDGDDADISN
jgi:general secretion pathway protein G